MKERVLLILILFCFQRLSASLPDSLVKFNDLVFKNEVEKSAFKKKSLKDTTNIIHYFLTPFDKEKGFDPVIADKKINDCISVLQKEIHSKTEIKRIKIIYDHVHKAFLKVYKLKNSFSDIFENGEYNCVSASALYAIIFSRLNVPYQIMETPQHVYLVAYPKTHKILIETTSPEKGYYQFNNNYVEKYVKNLYLSKLITKEEYESNTATTLFNKHYFSSENISLMQLAGLQYSNYGFYDLEDKKYELAISEIKKAYYLNPCEKHKYLLKSALTYQVSNNNYDNLQQISDLSILCRFNNFKDDELSNEMIRNEFIRVIQTQLIKNSDYTKFDTSYSVITSSISDTVLKNEIDFAYHYELSRIGYQNFQPSEYEIKHLLAAYTVNPRHADLQSIILSYFSRVMEKISDPSVILSLMKDYTNKFNFLNDNTQFNNVKSNCFLELSYQNFSINNISKGESYLKEFEKLIEDNEIVKPAQFYVEKAYSVAAGFYYKQGNYPKAKQFIKTGLLYAPDSFSLKQRLNQF